MARGPSQPLQMWGKLAILSFVLYRNGNNDGDLQTLSLYRTQYLFLPFPGALMVRHLCKGLPGTSAWYSQLKNFRSHIIDMNNYLYKLLLYHLSPGILSFQCSRSARV